MAIYSVSYDLNSPGQDYKDLFNLLESYGSYARPTESQWLIDTNETAVQIRDKINKVIDSNDTVIVIECGRSVAAYNVHPDVWDWIDKKF